MRHAPLGKFFREEGGLEPPPSPLDPRLCHVYGKDLAGKYMGGYRGRGQGSEIVSFIFLQSSY